MIEESVISTTTPVLHKSVQKVEPLPAWQNDFCQACGAFNGCQGCCPKSLDDCLLSRIQDCGGDIDTLRLIELGQGVTAGHVLDTWLNSGQPTKDLFQKPVWLFCIAEHLANNEAVESA